MAGDRVPQLELSNQLCFALYSASRAVIRAYGPALGELNLTYPQYLTMLVLWEAQAPLAVGDIGARLHLDSGTLTPVLKRLEEVGYVDRTRDPADERRVLVSLTDRGAALRAEALDVPIDAFRRLDVDLGTARNLIADLTRIVDALDGSASAPTATTGTRP